MPLPIIPDRGTNELAALKTGIIVATNDHSGREAVPRGARMLRTALGPAIASFLEDPAIVEVMLNADGRLWVDRLREGLCTTDELMTPPTANAA